MEDNVKKVMDFIARIAFCEIKTTNMKNFWKALKIK